MPEAAKMDDDLKAASDAKNVEGLEEDKSATIGSLRERLGRISEDPKETQAPFQSGIKGGNKLEPAGTDWEDDLSETSSGMDWRQDLARESTTFPQLSPLLKNRNRNTKEKGVRQSGRGLSEMLGYNVGEDPTPTRLQPAGQRAKFVLQQDIPDEFIDDQDIILKKENYGTPGTTEWRKNMVMATEPLQEPFGVAQHKVVHRVEDGDQQSFLHIQQMIVGVLHRVNEGHSRSKSMDWMDICLIPRLNRYNNSENCEDWWDESETNLWTDWDSLDVETIMAWQYSINKRFSREDRTGSRWLKEFVYKTSSDSLKSVIAKRYDRFSKGCLGGVM